MGPGVEAVPHNGFLFCDRNHCESEQLHFPSGVGEYLLLEVDCGCSRYDEFSDTA